MATSPVLEFATVLASHIAFGLNREMISCYTFSGSHDPRNTCHLWYDLDMWMGNVYGSKAEIKYYCEKHGEKIAEMISRRCDGASRVAFIEAESRPFAQAGSAGNYDGVSIALEGMYDVVNNQVHWSVRMSYEILPKVTKIGDTINIRTPPRFRVRAGPNFNP